MAYSQLAIKQKFTSSSNSSSDISNDPLEDWDEEDSLYFGKYFSYDATNSLYYDPSTSYDILYFLYDPYDNESFKDFWDPGGDSSHNYYDETFSYEFNFFKQSDWFFKIFFMISFLVTIFCRSSTSFFYLRSYFLN